MTGGRSRRWAEGDGDLFRLGPFVARYRYELDARRLILRAHPGGVAERAETIPLGDIAFCDAGRVGRRAAVVVAAANLLPARLPAFAEHGLVRAARGLTVITLPLPAPGAAALLAAFAELGIPTEDAAGEVAARERFRDDLEQLLRAARGTYALHREWHGPLIGGGVAAVVALLVAYVGPRPSPGVSLILGLLAAICWLVALLSFLSLPQRLIVGPTGLRLEGHLPRSRVIAADDILGFETASIRNGEILLIAVAGGNDQVRLTPALRAAFARAGPDVLGRLGLPAGWVNLRVAGTGRC